MARGYPDFFGFSVFPWYGNSLQVNQNVGVASGATETILLVTGKSVIFNAAIHLDGAVTHSTDIAILDIDGVQVSTCVWGDNVLRLQGFATPTEPMVQLVNEELFTYRVEFVGIFSVGLSVGLRYTNNSVELRQIRGGITYSPIV